MAVPMPGRISASENRFVLEAVVDDPQAEGNQNQAGQIVREMSRSRCREGRKPAAEKQNRAEARHRDHAGVFGDEKHGELEAGILGVESGDEFGFGFRQIERHAIGFRDGGDEEAEEADDLRKCRRGSR